VDVVNSGLRLAVSDVALAISYYVIAGIGGDHAVERVVRNNLHTYRATVGELD
jgi:hypothetical protein